MRRRPEGSSRGVWGKFWDSAGRRGTGGLEVLEEFGEGWLCGFQGLGDNWVYLFGDGEELQGV